MSIKANILLCAIALGTTSPAHADTAWDAAHPRRDQVIDRTHHLDQRIARERREGEIGPARALALHREVRRIRMEQRRMAQANGGAITRAQQARLNQQEDAVSRQIGR